MEILKRKSILIITIILFSVNITNAQSYDEIIQAFSSSYTQETNGEYSKAINTLKAVYDENSYEINLRLGWLNYMLGLFTESQTYYQKAITLKPYSVEAKLGFAYPASGLGNWDQVKNKYFEILKIDPQNSLVNYRLGSIYYGKEDYISAKKYFEKVVNLYPFDYDSVIMLAWTCLKKSEFREAKVLFNKALMMKSDDESALEGLKLIK